MRSLLLLILALTTFSAQAADRYVRQGASGNGTGTDWANAYASLPTTMIRGDTYYIADGSYGSLQLSTPSSGSSFITIKKATESSHGTSVGWNSAYGDGQAVFGSIVLTTDNWIIDGTTRNESAWNDGASYGFKAGDVTSNRLSHGACSDNVTIQFVNIDSGGTTGRPLYLGGFGGGAAACANWVIRRNYVHAGGDSQLVGALNTLIEYNWFGPTWGKEIIRGQVSTVNTTIRYNIFRDGCRDDNNPGGGCTAEIAFFGNQGDTPDFEGVYIYGNVIWKTIGQHKTDATFMFEANNCKIYNNTVVDNAPSGSGRFICGTGAGSVIQNNVTYYPGGLGSGCTAATCSNNSHYTTSPPFVNVTAGNFGLTGPLGGIALSTPYNLDLAAKARGADGLWDRGAFEYGGGGASTALTAPTGLTVR